MDISGTGGNDESALPRRNRIFLVQGEHYIASFVAYVLGRAGYQVAAFDSAPEAIHSAQRDPPDLVIVDVWWSGFFDLSLVRQFAALPGLTVMVLSDAPSSSQRRQTLAAGAADYVSSPVSASELVQSVQAVLRGSQSPG